MKIIACDDDQNILKLLKEWVKDYMGEEAYTFLAYDNGIDLLAELDCADQMEKEILLMDIKLKNDNGINIAKVLREKKHNMSVIFISGYTEYFEDSFEAEPVYFLIKPLKKDTFYKAMDKGKEKLEEEPKKFLLLKKKEVARIFFDDIYYAESVARKIHIHSSQGEVEYYEKMDDLEKKLEGDFVRCHKSYLVNMKYVRCVDNRAITLLDGRKIPVSRTNQAGTKEKVFEYLGRQL